MALKSKFVNGPKFIEPIMGINALSIANIVVLWNRNRVVEDKIKVFKPKSFKEPLKGEVQGFKGSIEVDQD